MGNSVSRRNKWLTMVARQTIHMKCHTLFSLKKEKKCNATILLVAFTVSIADVHFSMKL